MRRLGRNRAHSDEEESVFVTMTDMTISFLLIIMILLAFFATQLNDDETVPLNTYERVLQERDSLKVKNKELSSALAAVEIELARVQDELVSVTAERNQLRNEIVQLKSALEALEAELARIKAELASITAERDQLLEEIKRLRSENEALSDELALLRSELEEITADRDRIQDDLDKALAENETLKKRVYDLEDEVKRLRRQLEQLKAVNPLEAYLSQAIDQRREILVELKDRLQVEFPDLQVLISPEQDALRFQGEGLFRSGSSQLERRQRQIVDTMGRLLDEILICFTLGERAVRGPDCESGNALIEAVQIEGHTDSDGSDLNNLRLSTDRANATLLVMLGEDRAILAHENLRGQPVMSVSGYGEMRPIETNETTDGKAANRRIDLRIIMYAPSTVEEVEEVGRRLDALRAAGGAR
jgi:chemotaxis protein MotB